MERKWIIWLTAVTLCLPLLAMSAAEAAVRSVKADGTGQYATIQAAINASQTGDVVELADGTYQGTGNRDLDYEGKRITVRSASGVAADCVLDVEGSTSSQHRGFHFHTGEDTTAVVENLTVRNGYAGLPTDQDGGGIRCTGAGPMIRGCVIQSCYAVFGGAMVCESGASPIVRNCSFIDNRANDRGGAALVYESTATFRKCTFTGNHSDQHQAGDGGGVLWCSNNAQTTMDHCTLSENSSPTAGGIVVGDHGTVFLSNTIIAFGSQGKAMWLSNYGGPSSASLTCCDIFGNVGGDWTGGIEGQADQNGNISADPLFCDGAYTLNTSSPCARANSGACGFIGAGTLGCGDANFAVCPNGSGEYATIQAAVDEAWSGVVVELCDGTYTGSGNRDIDFHGKQITVRSASGNAANCIIDCEGSVSSQHRGFRFHTGENANAVVENLTVRNGYVDLPTDQDGGGIRCDGASPTIRGCVIQNCYANFGGGMTCDGGAHPTVTNCSFLGNSAYDRGGAALVYESSAAFSGCTFSGNRSNQHQYGDGGGVLWCSNNAQASMDHCTLNNNSSPTAGGIVVGDRSNVSLSNTIISFGPQGKAIWLTNYGGPSSATLTCCDIFGNAGGDWVGGIEGQRNQNENIWADPLYCSESLTLQGISPCADRVTCGGVTCGQIGAHPVGCGPNLLVVRDDRTGSYPTIQAAMDASAAGDIVELCDGTYIGEGNHDIDFHGKQVTVRSASGNAANCVIDCQGSTSNQHRGFFFHTGESGAAVVENLTVMNGRVDLPTDQDGGGIRCEGASPTIRGCVIRDCYAVFGGAMACDQQSSPTLTDCSFLSNEATDRGGAAIVYESNATFRRCLFAGNYSGQHQYGDGGGVLWCSNNAETTMEHCTLSHNSSPTAGGIVVGDRGSVILSNTIISLGSQGQAMWLTNYGGPSSATLACCDIFGNAGGDWTGGIEGQLGQNGNFSADPLYCDGGAGTIFTLDRSSPCFTGACGEVGALGVGCPTADTPDVVAQATDVLLLPNRPNPFQGQTLLAFELPRDAAVRLDVVDVSGRRVASLAEGEWMTAGPHTMSWDGRSAEGKELPAGVYYGRLIVGNEVRTRSMLLFRN